MQLANRIDDDCSPLLLDKALQAYGGALTIFGESSYPQPWARVQAMLAHIHFALARRNEGSAPVPHLRAALVAVDNALRVFDPVHSSYHLATTTKLHEAISAKLRDMSNDL